MNDDGFQSLFLIHDQRFTCSEVDSTRRQKIKMHIFRWQKLVLNLLRSKTYDPTRPWVFKIEQLQ